MIWVSIDDGWRVDCVGEVRVALPASVVWGQMRDLLRFVCIDPLHARARTLDGGPARLGSELVIEHRLLGLGTDRVSRVLRWREGSGYAISDLSRRGVRRGFPHVCTYEVVAEGPGECRVLIGARGLWTARWMPRFVARAWVWWILMATGVEVRWEMGALKGWLERRGTVRAGRDW
jgi:hypothetical protein